jgi:hypothetical protein
MPDVTRVGDLELGQDLAYQRREWAFERAGWLVLAAIVLLGLLGLLGRGPLSTASGTDPRGALRLEYNRFLHYRDPDTLKVRLAKGASAGGEVHLWLAADYLARIEITRVSPEAERVEVGEDWHVYVFPVADRGLPAEITFHIEAEGMGKLPGRVGLGGGEPLEFWQFVYP